MNQYINSANLRIESRSANESFSRSAAAAFAAQLDPTIEEINDIKTAVSEAVTNCIVHAYPDSVGKIDIAMRVYPDGRFVVIVKDRGCGIPDVKKAMEPMFTTGNADRSGMGFTIMESFMDKVSVRSVLGRGVTVTMMKRISPRGSAPK